MTQQDGYDELARRFAEASEALENVAASAEALSSTNEAISASSAALGELARELSGNASALGAAAEALQRADLDALATELSSVRTGLGELKDEVKSLSASQDHGLEQLRRSMRTTLIVAIGAMVGSLAAVGAILLGLG